MANIFTQIKRNSKRPIKHIGDGMFLFTECYGKYYDCSFFAGCKELNALSFITQKWSFADIL